MSFRITLMRNASNPNIVNKNLTDVAYATGTLKTPTSILDPVIVIDSELSESMIGSVNYVHIPDFKRYYYVTNIISNGYRLWELHMHVDVLMTYKDYLKNQEGIIARQQNVWNVYLDDGSFPAYQQVQVQQKNFTNETPFEEQCFVLIVAGS